MSDEEGEHNWGQRKNTACIFALTSIIIPIILPIQRIHLLRINVQLHHLPPELCLADQRLAAQRYQRGVGDIVGAEEPVLVGFRQAFDEAKARKLERDAKLADKRAGKALAGAAS